MNQDENSFQDLRQLLTLKRHEIPPPGYFNKFSGSVIARIQAGEGSAKNGAEENSPAQWFQKFLQLFELKPAFAGAFASAVCLLLFFGIFYADRPDAGIQPFLQNSEPSMESFAAMSPGAASAPKYSVGLIASNNPAASLQPVASFFGSQNSLVQPVSFSTDSQ